MPLPDEVRKGMESDVADISRSTPAWTGPATCCRAASSCASSSPTDVAWAHIDIAGPSYHSGEATGYWTKGGTGVPVRTLLALIEDIAANG